MLLIVVPQKTLESPLDCKEIKPVNPKGNNPLFPLFIIPNTHWKDWCWSSNTLATWYEELTHWKRPWCWERLKVGGERDNRGWDGWMVSPTQQMWVWVSSGSWWWTGKPGVLQSMRSQRVRHDWATELKWMYTMCYHCYKCLWYNSFNLSLRSVLSFPYYQWGNWDKR